MGSTNSVYVWNFFLLQLVVFGSYLKAFTLHDTPVKTRKWHCMEALAVQMIRPSKHGK
jgi:hypothetical protein